MNIETGTQLGHYKVLGPAGAGGMGEVYKATDTRLDRTVAIKVLTAKVSHSPDVKARFEREAKVIASLNHPNICTLYDIGEHEGADYLVMEYIEGEALNDIVAKGAMKPDELLPVAIQIADALDKAHKQGLVHRDLKPGNVMLTKDGAKLLDFGLAKLTDGTNSTPNLSAITQTTPLTGQGTIIGTMHYMAPEQLEGKEADARSDIFSFGATLYEMATGKRAFAGESQASLIASVLTATPEAISASQSLAPVMLDKVVSQCLSKDPDQRWQTAGDLKRALQWIAEGGSAAGFFGAETPKAKRNSQIGWVVAAIFVTLSAILGYMTLFQTATPVSKVYSKLHLPEDNQMTGLGGGSLSLSPDGLKIAFVSRDTVSGKLMLWVRSLNSDVALQLPGTESAYFPFWSHDDRYIAFFSDRDQKLKKILASGGPALTICDASSGRPGDWNTDDVILFSPTQSEVIHRVSASGGESSPVTTLDSTFDDFTHRWVRFLPDGDHFIFFIRTGGGGGSESDVIAVSSLSQPGVIKRLLHTKSSVAYSQGHILYMRESTLMARPLDLDELEFSADGFPIAENVSYLENWSRGVFSASPDGKLAFREGSVSTGSQLLIYDTTGSIIDSVGEQVQQYSQEWSPDETQIAVDINDQSSSQWDIWIHHLERGIKTRLTFDSDDDFTPVWSPNGQEIAFVTARADSFEIYIKPVSGAGGRRLTFAAEEGLELFDWSADGRFLVFGRDVNSEDIWALDLKDSAEAFPLIATEFREREARFSPDGRWIAYMSNESGKQEVYVAPFPGPGGKWQVSNDKGDRPHWSADGTKLFYLDNKETLNVAEVDGSGSGFRVGKVKKLFEINGYRPSDVYEASVDGSRFLVNSRLEGARPTTTITLIQNWHAEINK